MKSQTYIILIAILCSALFILQPCFAGDGFTQKDRELLITLKVKMEEMNERFKQVDNRFEQVDKRFGELRSDMNNRFEQVDKRFEQMMDFLYILTSIFVSLIAVVIGFAYWDRRTILYKVREEVREITKDDRKLIKEIRLRLDQLQGALQKMATISPEFKDILTQMRLL